MLVNTPCISPLFNSRVVHLVASSNPPCFLLPNPQNTHELRTIFLRDGWRKRLCRCPECCVSLISYRYSNVSLIRNYTRMTS